MTFAEMWGNALVLMLSWPPIGATEIQVYTECGLVPAFRAVRGWLK